MSADEVDEYLRGFDEPKRSTLEALRHTSLEIVPEAELPSNGAGRATAACCVQQVVAVRAAAGAPRKHPHPYWPGGAVLIEPGADRRAIGLIDDLAEDLLY